MQESTHSGWSLEEALKQVRFYTFVNIGPVVDKEQNV